MPKLPSALLLRRQLPQLLRLGGVYRQQGGQGEEKRKVGQEAHTCLALRRNGPKKGRLHQAGSARHDLCQV